MIFWPADWKMKFTGEKIEVDQQKVKACEWKIKVGERKTKAEFRNFFEFIL
jgi:hypothetical protein